MSETLTLRGTLYGHSGWVTSIATTNEEVNMILSSSRDKTILAWQVDGTQEDYGFPRKSLRGHSHFVSSVVISSDGQFALSGSWDGCVVLPSTLPRSSFPPSRCSRTFCRDFHLARRLPGKYFLSTNLV